MYIKSGHRFLSDKGQIVFPGPPTRSAFSFSYTNAPTTTTTSSTTSLPNPPHVDEYTNYIDMWRSKSASSSDMLSDKIQMFYIYITVTITSVLVLIILGIFGYMCYKRKGFQNIENQNNVESHRRYSYRSSRSHSRNFSREREVEAFPEQTFLRQ
ncbi:uncharacterized protein LOC131436724 [Malaya genurostris]|uniref:uncharacterized protein LOC131436724 n=1 Tax=Malaya genurostris TaxID=325434 RepID=UPI0026F390C3|nr:uncharacterized protein LOC131436724 [Malaya genurostris]XP_058461584.1 uncharacterized protein LOC131436724 [Malaya genurostris]